LQEIKLTNYKKITVSFITYNFNQLYS